MLPLAAVGRSVPVLATTSGLVLLLVLLHSSDARPQGRALFASPSINKLSSGKYDSHGDYFHQTDDKDYFNMKPSQVKTSEQKKVKQYYDHRTYNNKHDDIVYEAEVLYDKESQDDPVNAKYGGLGVILGRQNPLRKLG